MKKIISILIPIFNEKENINIIYNKIINTTASIIERYDYEILFLDNHSNDGSYEICKSIAKNNKNTRVIRHSRNFGYQSNILSGYNSCIGDCAITIDSDGQDDPKYILDFISIWERGYDVVYGIRKTRKDNFFIKILVKLFYKLLNYFSDISIPANAGDFRLIDKKIILHLKKFKEKNIFLRGVIFYLGFNQIGLEYDREKRLKGKSKFSLLQYFDFGQNGILSFSKFPLKFITVFGFLIFNVFIALPSLISDLASASYPFDNITILFATCMIGSFPEIKELIFDPNVSDCAIFLTTLLKSRIFLPTVLK